MFTNLPFDIQQFVYTHLDGKTRAKLRIALPKASKIGNKYIEQQLAVTDNFIRRYKHKIHNKEKRIPLNMQSFLKTRACEDAYAKSLCREINMSVDADDDRFSNCIDVLIRDIKQHELSKSKLDKYLAKNNNRSPVMDLDTIGIAVYNALAECTPEEFDLLFNHPYSECVIETVMQRTEYALGFCFNLINTLNESLLAYILDHPILSSRFRPAFQEVERPSICSIFHNTLSKVQLMMKYLNLSQESKVTIFEKAELHLSVEVALMMQPNLANTSEPLLT
jgi:hypothetical protein